MDAVFILALVAFVGAMVALTVGCARLGGRE